MTDHTQEYQTETLPDGTLVLIMPTTLDAVSAPNIKRDALEALAGNDHSVRADLQNTTFMDSSGLGLMVALYRTAKERGFTLTLAGAKGQPLSLIRTIQMDRVVDIESA